MNRRALLDTLITAGLATMLSPLIAGAVDAEEGVKNVFVQDLPHLVLDKWKMTALEVTYGPGEMDEPHRHPGFVLGYVIEGALRFQVDGGTATTYHAGQMFYEAPGSVHRVSGNASSTQPARLLAMIFAPRDATLTTPV